MTKFTVALALALASATPAGFALAAPGEIKISTAGLDLTTQAGVKALHQRVRAAATEICAQPENNDVDPDRCRAATLKDMEPQIRASIALAQANAAVVASK